MKIIKVKNYEEMSVEAAKIFEQQINANASSVLGLATGGTPERMYDLLIEANQSKKISFADITSFNLDEYVGIEKSHPMSYDTYMKEKLFNQIDISMNNVNIPSGVGNIEENGKAYDQLIESKGGIDLQCLVSVRMHT